MVDCTCDWIFYSVIAPISGRGPAHQQHGGKTAPCASATVTSSGVRGHGHGTTEGARTSTPAVLWGGLLPPLPKRHVKKTPNFESFVFQLLRTYWYIHSVTSTLQHSSSITFPPRESIDHQQHSNAHSNASSAHPPSVSLTQQHRPPSTNNQPVFLTLGSISNRCAFFLSQRTMNALCASILSSVKGAYPCEIHQCIAYYCSIVDAVFACRLSECLQRV